MNEWNGKQQKSNSMGTESMWDGILHRNVHTNTHTTRTHYGALRRTARCWFSFLPNYYPIDVPIYLTPTKFTVHRAATTIWSYICIHASARHELLLLLCIITYYCCAEARFSILICYGIEEIPSSCARTAYKCKQTRLIDGFLFIN